RLLPAGGRLHRGDGGGPLAERRRRSAVCCLGAHHPLRRIACGASTSTPISGPAAPGGRPRLARVGMAIDTRRAAGRAGLVGGDGPGVFVGGGRRIGFTSPKVRFTPEERLADMDGQGVDMQVLSIHTPFFGYHLPAEQGRALAREVNDEIAGIVRRWPQRFAGLATPALQGRRPARE